MKNCSIPKIILSDIELTLYSDKQLNKYTKKNYSTIMKKQHIYGQSKSQIRQASIVLSF